MSPLAGGREGALPLEMVCHYIITLWSHFIDGDTETRETMELASSHGVTMIYISTQDLLIPMSMAFAQNHPTLLESTPTSPPIMHSLTHSSVFSCIEHVLKELTV